MLRELAETLLLGAMISSSRWVGARRRYLRPDIFDDPARREIARRLLRGVETAAVCRGDVNHRRELREALECALVHGTKGADRVLRDLVTEIDVRTLQDDVRWIFSDGRIEYAARLRQLGLLVERRRERWMRMHREL